MESPRPRLTSKPRTATFVVGLCTLAAVALTASGHAQPAAGGYRVGPGDELQIEVFEDSSLNVTRRIAADGSITLPLTGPLPVAGLTTETVERRMQGALEADFLQRATVAVTVTEYRSAPIRLLGAIAEPGTHYLTGRWTLLEAINAGGGLTGDHAGQVVVHRQSNDGRLTDTLEVEVQSLLTDADGIHNIIILADDVINVPVVEEITVYFLGEVRTQGSVSVRGRDRVTLLTAIAKAGGLTERASPRLTIRRDVGDGRRQEITANFQRILAGEDDDIELQNGDLIVVKESFF